MGGARVHCVLVLLIYISLSLVMYKLCVNSLVKFINGINLNIA